MPPVAGVSSPSNSCRVHPLTPASNHESGDTVEYTLTIDHDGRRASYSANATSVSREFADVLKSVKLSKPAARSRGGGDP